MKSLHVDSLRSSSAARSGFTLVELLVVIAIIALLAAMLIGGLGGVKESARITHCSGLLVGTGKGFNSFAISNDDRLARSDNWPELIAQYMGAKIGANDAQTLTNMSKAKIQLCPTSFRAHKGQADATKLITFSRNGMLAPIVKGTIIDTPRISDFEVTSKTMLALDGIFDAGTKTWKRKALANSITPEGYHAAKQPGFVHARDNTRVNVVFMDGHVSTLTQDRVPNRIDLQSVVGNHVASGSLFWTGRQDGL